MEVSVQPQRLSLISLFLWVFSWRTMKRSSSMMEVHPNESRDGHRMEHNFHHRCPPVRNVLDSSLIWTINSIVLNTTNITCCADHCGIPRVKQRLWPEQVVRDRVRLPSTILSESSSRRRSTCMSLIPRTIEFNCFTRERSLQQRWRSMERMEHQSYCRHRQEWCWMGMDIFSLLIEAIIASSGLVLRDFDAWRVVPDRRVPPRIIFGSLERWISTLPETCWWWTQTIIDFRSSCWQGILVIVSEILLDMSNDGGIRSGIWKRVFWMKNWGKKISIFHLDSNSTGFTSTVINAGEEKIFFSIFPLERTSWIDFLLQLFLRHLHWTTIDLHPRVSAIDVRFLLDICQSLVQSFNQPNFCPNASWNPNAITVTDNNTIGSHPSALFVNRLNTLFVAHPRNGQILIWRNGSVSPTTTILANLSYAYSLFVTDDEEIFVDNGNTYNQVARWSSNGTQLPSPMSICWQCYGLFIDSNDQLYCSQQNAHQVLRRSLQSPSSPTTIVAGTGCPGSTVNTLDNPWGIFVTDQFDLSVADFYNSRIQLFRSGEINATTVVGNGSTRNMITLNYPSGVMLDGDGYLFVLDRNNHRVIGSGPQGFRCVAGCSGLSGSASNQLFYPQAMNFDRDGNILVLDTENGRVQKFFLATNSCHCESTWQEIAGVFFFPFLP